jgi:hypothetical protein
MLFGIRAISPQSPGVGNQFHDVAANTVNPIDTMITVIAILSKVPTFIFYQGNTNGTGVSS